MNAKFRLDINGLRGWAVIFVLLFHFFPIYFPGGFLGVDIFFVISGFLMTRIIANNLNQKSWLLGFYFARAIRIFPPLLVLLSILLLSSWVLFSPNDFKELSKEVFSASLFLSNIYYLRTSGYFDASSLEKALLHTWSLSVEWQFYILYPIVLLLVSRFFGEKQLLKFLTIVTLLGMVGAIIGFEDKNLAYFSLLSRFWEMTAGGVIYFLNRNVSSRNHRLDDYLFYLCCIIILTSFFVLNESFYWPGFWAVLNVLAVMTLISLDRSSYILTNKLIQFFGTISYSLYLWHWPLVVLIYYFSTIGLMDTDDETIKILAILTSVFIAYISYQTIEKRSKTIFRSLLAKIFLIIFVIVIAIFSFGVYKNNGVPSRVSEKVLISDAGVHDRNHTKCLESTEGNIRKDGCILGDENNIKMILLGDSHVDSIISGISDRFDLSNEGVLIFAKSACPTVFGAKSKRYSNSTCDDFNRNAIAHINQLNSHVDRQIPVLIVNRTVGYLYGQSDPARIKAGDNSPDVYFDKKYNQPSSELNVEFSNRFQSTLCSLVGPKYLLATTPEIGVNVPKKLSRTLMINNSTEDVSISRDSFDNMSSPIDVIYNKVSYGCGVKIIDVKNNLCNKEVCFGSLRGRPLYYDGDHLNDFGASLIMNEIFNQVLDK